MQYVTYLLPVYNGIYTKIGHLDNLLIKKTGDIFTLGSMYGRNKADSTMGQVLFNTTFTSPVYFCAVQTETKK